MSRPGAGGPRPEPIDSAAMLGAPLGQVPLTDFETTPLGQIVVKGGAFEDVTRRRGASSRDLPLILELTP